MKRRYILIFVIILILGAGQLIILGLLYYFNFGETVSKVKFGATFAPAQARYFGMDPKKVLTDALDDLGIKNYRLSAYWNVVEPSRGGYDWSEVDWQLDEVAKRNGSVILAIGRRLPRWPECHDPGWIKKLPEKQTQREILNLLKATINRYKNNKIITAWQVENEPFLAAFGQCPPPDADFYEKELKLVRSLDKRPIIMTESGELSTWIRAAVLADKVGISLYRVVWSKVWGTFYYPLTPAYYRYRAQAIRALGKSIFVSELQAEPWERGTPLPEVPILEQKSFLDGAKIHNSIDFAKRASFDEIYFWGLEWWDWLKSHGDKDIWNTIKQEVANQQ